MVCRPVWALLALVLVALFPGRAWSHPLGNFTINHQTRAVALPGRLRLAYALDVAEIPAFQFMRANGGAWNARTLQRWAADETAVVAGGLEVSVDGRLQALTARDAAARLRPGAGGLPTLYWTATFDVPLARGAEHRVEIEDRVYADRRIGWKDVLVGNEADPTHALTAYPSDLIGSPRHNDVARFVVSAAGTLRDVAVGGEDFAAQSTSAVVRSGYLADLFARPDQSAWIVLLTVLVAFGLGALHGLEPGHGKALLAFTLVGSRATVKQAAILALALTFAHTIAVLLLGLALFFVADFASETIFGWITLVSGAAIAFVGARSLAAAIAHARPNHEHAHALPGTRPLGFGSAVVAATSGGIAPCPAAIVVLLTALHLHRVGYGIALIVVFSLGLASVLAVLGVAVVHGARWLGRQGRFERLMRYAPIATAVVISVVGAVMLGQGFVQQGVAVSMPAVVGLTLAAIAGYALVPRHSHGSAEEASQA